MIRSPQRSNRFRAGPAFAASTSLVLVLASCAPSDGSGDGARSEEGVVEGGRSSPEPEVEWEEGLHPVTRERGSAVVRIGRFEGESTTQPWSGWWYPAQSRELFESENRSSGGAPLEKYDRWTSRRGRSRESASFERDRLYRANALPWEGLCDAWALASLMEPEPTQTIEREGIRFSVGDQKALLTKIWERADGKRIYGAPFRGDADSRHEDLLPEEFHRFLQTELFEGGRPFIFDKDPGIAIWNTPVWKASVTIERDDEEPKNAVRVEASLLGADPWIDGRDMVGTHAVQFQYLYRLSGAWEGEDFHVSGGEWIAGDVHGSRVDSRSDHPDYVVSIPSKGLPHFSRNTELDADGVHDLIAGEGPRENRPEPASFLNTEED